MMEATDDTMTQGELLDLFPRMRWNLEERDGKCLAVDREMSWLPPVRRWPSTPMELLRASDEWHARRDEWVRLERAEKLALARACATAWGLDAGEVVRDAESWLQVA
jgi:hypothetical protein